MSHARASIPPSSGRILAVDPGKRRIGLAISDPDRILAQPLLTLDAHGRRRDTRAILEAAREHEAVAIVVGLPVNMDGSRGPAHEEAMRLIDSLRREDQLPVFGWDERLTSAQARRALVDSGSSRSRRRDKGAVDRIAAALILESFLASLASGAAAPDASS